MTVSPIVAFASSAGISVIIETFWSNESDGGSRRAAGFCDAGMEWRFAKAN